MKKRSHQEILEERKSLSEMENTDRLPFVFLLNNIRSMHNIGSVFRTADAACLEKIYLTGYTASPPRDEINKSALGATESVPWEYIQNPLDCIHRLKSMNYSVLALEQSDESKSIYSYEVERKEKYCIILGNEVFGVDDELLDACDGAVEIPMFGMKHSLNVSVAAGIVVYEWLRRFKALS